MAKTRLILLSFLFLFSINSYPQELGRSGLGVPPPYIQENDGSPASRFTKLIVDNGSLVMSGTHAHVTASAGAMMGAAYWTLTTAQTLITGNKSGSFDLSTTGLGTFGTLKVTTTPTAGYVLTSDVDGNGTWQVNAGSMVYPDSGIAVSNGSGWDSSITNNSSNWDTAYGWGNHGSVGYFYQSSQVDHNSTTNYSANRHIDWTAATSIFKTTVTSSPTIVGTETYQAGQYIHNINPVVGASDTFTGVGWDVDANVGGSFAGGSNSFNYYSMRNALSVSTTFDDSGASAYAFYVPLEFTGSVTADGSINFGGLYVYSTANMGTTGTTGKFGTSVYLSGTADVNIGASYNVSGATANKAINIVAGNVHLLSDSITQYFGAANDASINFDGNSLNIIANLVTGADTLNITAASVQFGTTNLLTTGTIGGGATTVTNLTDGGLTITRVPYASTSGLLIDDAAFTFTTATGLLSTTKLIASSQVNVGTLPVGYETFSFGVNTSTGGIILNRTSTTEPAFIVLKNDNTVGGQLRSLATVDGIGLAGTGGNYTLKSFSGKVLIGANLTATSAASTLHLYEDTTATGTANGITIEQDGTGDATLQFLLTGVKRWMCGIDNSDSDKWKIGSGISDLANALGLIIDTSNNIYLGAKILTYDNIATEGYGVPAIVDHVALTAQAASIGTTNFTNAGTAGLYRVNYYLEATTLNAGATSVLATFGWTDDAGATTTVSATLVLTALGRTSGIFYVQLASGNITYATTLVDVSGLARYALYATCERVN